MERLSKSEYFMNLARMIAMRSTCSRAQVGAVFVDSRGHILSTGYNGVPSNFEHEAHQHETSDCLAIHAEQNAIIQCKDPFAIDTIYVTLSPCKTCLLQICNTSCRKIVYLEEYRVSNSEVAALGNINLLKYNGRLLNLECISE